MAFSEVERVALYWSKSAILSLRQEEPAVRLMLACEKPSTHIGEILNGGCLLYRIDRSPGVDNDHVSRMKRSLSFLNPSRGAHRGLGPVSAPSQPAVGRLPGTPYNGTTTPMSQPKVQQSDGVAGSLGTFGWTSRDPGITTHSPEAIPELANAASAWSLAMQPRAMRGGWMPECSRANLENSGGPLMRFGAAIEHLERRGLA